MSVNLQLTFPEWVLYTQQQPHQQPQEEKVIHKKREREYDNLLMDDKIVIYFKIWLRLPLDLKQILRIWCDPKIDYYRTKANQVIVQYDLKSYGFCNSLRPKEEPTVFVLENKHVLSIIHMLKEIPLVFAKKATHRSCYIQKSINECSNLNMLRKRLVNTNNVQRLEATHLEFLIAMILKGYVVLHYPDEEHCKFNATSFDVLSKNKNFKKFIALQD